MRVSEYIFGEYLLQQAAITGLREGPAVTVMRKRGGGEKRWKKRIVRVVVMARIVCLCCGNTIFRDAVTSITTYIYAVRVLHSSCVYYT